jgi:hypothetical protein
VRMAVTLGLRAGEMFALRWNDVEPERLRIDESREFRGKGTKDTKTEDSAVQPLPSIRFNERIVADSCGTAYDRGPTGDYRRAAVEC